MHSCFLQVRRCSFRCPGLQSLDGVRSLISASCSTALRVLDSDSQSHAYRPWTALLGNHGKAHHHCQCQRLLTCHRSSGSSSALWWCSQLRHTLRGPGSIGTLPILHHSRKKKSKQTKQTQKHRKSASETQKIRLRNSESQLRNSESPSF